ncbi:asparagine synthase (glutamine-hydrolyzing) [Geomonas agri]|uniref:asparagine synthase (glutamine-hydrolyzing) n=1 Tax=Geomonas agri TaxID=2873702 RepID=UPI001CD2E272|nr:asparagine synthase (glutamine-hydrolyzing) [Geomonas agri]
MCGIAGIVAPQAERFREQLRLMTDSLAHRGPDGAGSSFFANCALGHRRLAIVDLEGGRQPMLSSDGSTGITFNGEIYGYQDIRRYLEPHPFVTSSDTEVILALYGRHGREMLRRLPGMFSFAIWDDARQELFCARDRFGEKPFYYAVAPEGELVFASELKAILASGMVRPQLDRLSLAHYLKHLYVPCDRTIYSNIHQLPPAHALVWSGGRVTVSRYWELPPPAAPISLDDAVERFRELMGRAIERQLVADVEVGAFLSGGLDSSTIVALASERAASLKTFAFGFGKEINELPYAREIAARYGTDHRELLADRLDLPLLLHEMATCYDEPFADSSNIPTFVMCREAARTLKVVLTGDGGDELLGGYSWYRPLYWADSAAARDRWKMMLVALAWGACRRTGVGLPMRWRELAGGYHLGREARESAELHRRQNVYFSDAELSRFGLELPPVSAPTLFGGVDDALRMDLCDYLPGDILTKIDRAAMAHGLELRAPFLDLELASFLAGLPVALKLSDSQDKMILRQAFGECWTPAVRSRGKQGFGAPVAGWMAQDALQDMLHQYLLPPGGKLVGFFDSKELARIAAGRDYQSWILLVLAIWMEHHDFSA